MMMDAEGRFGQGAGAWAHYNRMPLGRIRGEVTWHNLARHLPAVTDSARPPCILDVGGGSGELALRLVQHGYRVWLSDCAPAMLALAQQAAVDLPADVCARLTLCEMAADDAARSFAPGFFDAITCHTLIEYLPDPCSTLQALTGLLCAGGLLSVSFVNRHAEVLRQVWSRADPAGALACLEEGAFCATLFDVTGIAYTAEQVSAWLFDLGLTVVDRCGVRIFADYVPRERLDDADFVEALLCLEKAVASRPPYNLVARYVHLLASKAIER